VRSVAFHPEADAEFLAAARYYEGQAENLGLDFVAAVQRTYQRLAAFPESGHPFGSRLRCAVPSFLASRTASSIESNRSASSSLPSLTYTAGPATGGPGVERRAAQRGSSR
jgi:plasmid stabilization system protein ParE